ncbi:hypothetical protein D3C83_132710 [compost metagenome]
MAQVTGAAEVLNQAPADRIRVVAMGVAEVLLRPGVGLPRELGVFLLKKRPVVMREPVHQSPSNAGFCLAANAS